MYKRCIRKVWNSVSARIQIFSVNDVDASIKLSLKGELVNGDGILNEEMGNGTA